MEQLLESLMRQTMGGGGGGRGGQPWGAAADNGVLDALNSEDELTQMQALDQLCNELIMATPFSLAMLNTNALVPPILGCVRKAHNPELQLLAARALTYMTDALPRASQILSANNNVEALLEPVTAIQDVELAEQCLSCIEKLCQTPAGASATFRANGISTMLSFVDFFTTGTQRKIWTSIARMCKCVDTSGFNHVRDCLPTIRSATLHSDVKIRGRAMSALLRVTFGVRKNSNMVDEVFVGMTEILTSVVARPDSTDSTFSDGLMLIHAAVTLSANATRQVIESGLLTALLRCLDNNAVSAAPDAPVAEATNESMAEETSSGNAVSPVVSSPTGGNSAVERQPLSFESSKVLCGTLAALLVPTRDGPFAYEDDLIRLELKEAASALTSVTPGGQPLSRRGGAGQGDGDDDGDDADDWEDEEDGFSEDGDEKNEEERPSTNTDNAAELRAQIAKSNSISLRVQSSHARLRTTSHICDGCNKACSIQNWYRCNECRDCDFCGACLLRQNADHFGGQHTFTDMQTLFPSSNGQPLSHSDPEKAKLSMYKENPGLLTAVLEAVPSVVTLSTESESAVIRVMGARFLLAAATMASSDLLQSSEMSSPAACEALMAFVTDSSLFLNLAGVHTIAQLLQKNKPAYAQLLVREGVSAAVDHLSREYYHKLAASVKVAEDKAASPALAQQVRSMDGWRRIVGEEAHTLMDKHPSLHCSQRSEALEKLVKLLREDKLLEAAVALKEAVLSSTTAYEFSSQNVFGELRKALTRCGGNADAILRVAFTLSEGEAQPASQDAHAEDKTSSRNRQSTSALGEFVRLLHTELTHLDAFAAPQFGSIHSIHARIPLELVRDPSLSDRATVQPALPTPKKDRAGGAGSNSKSGAGHLPHTHVSIEPLASVAAICGFVSRNLLRQNDKQRARLEEHANVEEEDTDDGVDDVLPELGGASVGRDEGARRKKKDTSPGVWIRYENKILPLSMTMMQVLQNLVTPKGKGKNAGGAKRTSGATEPIRLYYSNKPFDGPYEMLQSFKSVPAEFEADVKVVVPSKDARPDGVARVLSQVNQSFAYSRTYLSGAQVDVLTLLGVFHAIVESWAELLQYANRNGAINEEMDSVWSPSVSSADFVHHKLNNKAMRHCSNLLLAGQHASTWAVNLALDCNFLFAPSTRKFMFEVSFCGTVRSLARMQQNLAKYGIRDRSSADHNSSRNIQLSRQKKRVWRQHPLECAMNLLGGSRVSGADMWEFEFYGEAGSGLGPTREFYTLVAKALRERSRKLWRVTNEGDDEKYFTPVNGLYPRQLSSSAPKAEQDEVKKHFRFIGRFVGRALLDAHVAALPLSPVFLKLIRGDPCGVHDIAGISESICDVLLAIVDAAEKHTHMVQLRGQKKAYPVESMSLTFTLPGDDSVDLCKGGADKEVKATNMAHYCDEVTAFILRVGVRDAVKAFREGFNDYIPLMALRMLSVEEFFEAINGYARPVTQQEFEENCLADHGFTLTCKHVQWLFEILASFNVEEQKRFFLFLTGSPNLPVGGMPSLRPKLTIVRKTASESTVKETDQLPSAMTCQHYLKLPAYESKEQMEEKLRQAVNEGTGAFLLS